MSIIRIDNRYFIVGSSRDVSDVALKVLNEDSRFNRVPSEAKEFVAAICDEMDGQSAFAMVRKMHDVEHIAPEVL